MDVDAFRAKARERPSIAVRRVCSTVAKPAHIRQRRNSPRFSARARQRVSKPQFDERLPSNPDSPRLTVVRPKQIYGKIDVHALDIAARARGFFEIEMRAEVFACIVHLVETLGTQRPSRRGTALLRLHVHGGPR